jgi:dihydrodipicolinate synthase/N-acetylneuraminate lyase
MPIAWDEQGELDEATYRADLVRCCEAKVPGIYTGGSTGEFYALEIDEFETISRVTIETCRAHDTPVMIGCTATSTRGAARRAALAARLGADAIQVALPFWLEVQDCEVLPFFREVAAAANGLPFSIYETARAKKCLSIEQHSEIHRALPQYTMVKANGGTIGVTPEGCQALSSFVNVFAGEPEWARLGPYGVRGSCSAMIFWNPWVVLAAWRSLEQRDWPALQAAGRKITELHDFLIHAFGAKNFSDTADDRNVARATGFLGTSLRTRGPYGYASENDVVIVRQWLEKNYPEMLELRARTDGHKLQPHLSPRRQPMAAPIARK